MSRVAATWCGGAPSGRAALLADDRHLVAGNSLQLARTLVRPRVQKDPPLGRSVAGRLRPDQAALGDRVACSRRATVDERLAKIDLAVERVHRVQAQLTDRRIIVIGDPDGQSRAGLVPPGVPVGQTTSADRCLVAL